MPSDMDRMFMAPALRAYQTMGVEVLMLSDTEDEVCLKEWANVEDQQLHNILLAGVHMVAPSLRFATTKSGGKEVDLGHYIGGMKEGQEEIYYALGGSMGAVLEDPALQLLQEKGLEVVLMPHPELCLAKLGGYMGKKFVSTADYMKNGMGDEEQVLNQGLARKVQSPEEQAFVDWIIEQRAHYPA